MKKSILLVLLLVSCSVFSQKIIDKPNYGLSNLPGEITKIELSDTATILYFHVTYPSGQWIQVPKNTYLRDVNGGEKYLVTQTEGIPLGKRYTMPEIGEVSYRVFFPKLKNGINKIDYGEGDNNAENWSIYDIVINEQDVKSILPKVLLGNWFQTNGSKQWDYGFYANQAIFESVLWNYKSVTQKKNNFNIVLENKGREKTIFAKIDKKGNVSLGEDPKQLVLYSTEKLSNPNYKLENDEEYSSNILKTDTTVYSGYVKGYNGRIGKRTGTIYVNNVFSGNQDSYLIEIDENGAFSVKFPVNHSQYIYVDLLGNFSAVFVEPGKETFEVLGKDTALFMGDCARINSDLQLLKDVVSYENYRKLRENIMTITPEDYKRNCLDIRNKQKDALNQLIKKDYYSRKAIQLTTLDIDYMAYQQILSYDMYKEDLVRSNTSKKQIATETNDSKLSKASLDFITNAVLNDELAVMSQNYYIFINRLMYLDLFRVHMSSYLTLDEKLAFLEKEGVVFSQNDIHLLNEVKKANKLYEKNQGFSIKNYALIKDFRTKYKTAFDDLQKNNGSKVESIVEVATYLEQQKVNFTDEEKELILAAKASQLSKQESAYIAEFEKKYAEDFKALMEKHKILLDEIEEKEEARKLNATQKSIFGFSESFIYDVITLQYKNKYLERDFTPYTDQQLQNAQKLIVNPVLYNYLVYANNKMKNKLETNKTKTGFSVNTVVKSKGDELFDSMIAKFKGKVIYVDFWATWCGPCKEGIRGIAPLKEEMKDSDVVFLYITGETSPLKTWENSIPDIKGEHYRVTQDEWNYLTSKFNISGIPHYVLVNKNGEVVNPKLDHHSNESLKKILEKQL